MNKLLVSVILGFGLVGVASAGGLKQGYVGCTSKDALDEFINHSVKNDRTGMAHLIGKSCLYTGSLTQYEVSMLDQGFMTSKVRVYVKNDSLVLYIPAEAYRK